MPSVTREELRTVLLEWQAGSLAPLEVLDWAEEHIELDSPTDEVVEEILNRLDVLHVNLVTVEDVPVFLQMLALAPEKSHEALQLLENYEEIIDIEARKEKYKDHPIYGPML